MNRQGRSGKTQTKQAKGPPGKRGLRGLLASLRQLFYEKPFRIARPAWSAKLLRTLELAAKGPPDSHGQPSEAPSQAAAVVERKDFYKLIADVATGLWRAKKKMPAEGAAEPPEELRALFRHVESVWDGLSSKDVDVQDYDGERYVAGTAMRVIAFQPTPGTQHEAVAETIRPSVFYKDVLIQRAQVIVAIPEQAEAEQEEDHPAADDETDDRAAANDNEGDS